MVVRFSLILEGQSAVRHMVQVLQPFEVGDSHTTCIDVQVRNDQHIHILQNLVSSRGCGAIGSFSNDLQEWNNVNTGKREVLSVTGNRRYDIQDYNVMSETAQHNY